MGPHQAKSGSTMTSLLGTSIAETGNFLCHRPLTQIASNNSALNTPSTPVTPCSRLVIALHHPARLSVLPRYCTPGIRHTALTTGAMHVLPTGCSDPSFPACGHTVRGPTSSRRRCQPHSRYRVLYKPSCRKSNVTYRQPRMSSSPGHQELPQHARPFHHSATECPTQLRRLSHFYPNPAS